MCRRHQNRGLDVEEEDDVPEVVERPDRVLERLALDSQNVHTPPVMDMMRETFADIETPELGPPLIRTILTELKQRFTVSPAMQSDMRKWYMQATCATAGDYKYRRALNAVWAKIQALTGEVRENYMERLYTECESAVGMCFAGHVARLANACVGMADLPDIEGAVTKLELPDKMAHIAGIEDIVERMEAAYRAFAEYNVTETKEWIRALIEA
jgi:hypothetical protein